MNTREAYNIWAAQYDTNTNKTRDLEGKALRENLAGISFTHCLEIGCGTGKNTEWLTKKASSITAVDLSNEMLARAKEKISSANVHFVQANINEQWFFADKKYDLITYSLVLEHIENLAPIFERTAKALASGGFVYIGELHPFKQYTGSKARFDTNEERIIVDCYTHHLSEFIQAAKRYGLTPFDVNEYFDKDDRTTIPRILTILLQKS